MKFLKGIVLIVVAVLVYNWAKTPAVSQQINNQLVTLTTDFKNWSEKIPFLVDSKTETHSDAQSSTSTDNSGLESIVINKKLSNTYTYYFDSNVPLDTRQVFLQAIAVYNQTGIVKLTAEKQNESKNTLRLGIYNKTASDANNMQELGVGGPKIYSQYGLIRSDYNHGKATLNTAYPARLSAAIHEIGHAFGLDHTQNKDSVMYPVDQGKTTLSAQDVANLKKIYQ